MTVRAWFPTLVYASPLKRDLAFARTLLEECRRIRRNDVAGRAWSREHYPGGFTSYATMYRLQKTFSTFTELERRIDPHVKKFARRLEWDLGQGRLSMTDCWINVMPRRVTHGLHLHPQSAISGTYYVKTPKGCADLRLEDPRLDRYMAAPPKRERCRDENLHHVFYPAEAGTIVLFESWLRHEVSPNPTKEERVSVSFNYNWR